MKPRQSLLSSLIAVVLLFASAQPVRAGINRWTSGGPVAGINHLLIDPADSDVVYATTFTKSMFKSSNGGLTWSDVSSGRLDGVDFHSLAIDPRVPSTLCVGTNRGVFQSKDGGASWDPSLTAGSIYNLLFAQQSSTIYAADFDDVGYYPGPSSVYKSEDNGKTWTRKDTGFAIAPGAMVLDPANASTLYAGTFDLGGLYKSVDGGSSWNIASLDLASAAVFALAIDPQDPSRLFASAYTGIGSNGNIYRSEDAGATWRLVSVDLRSIAISALVVDPRDSGTLYAGSYRGVFQSTDGGVSWRAFSTVLTGFDVVTLAIDSTGRKLHAGSYSKGVFDYQISSGAVDLSVSQNGKTRLLFAESDGRMSLRSVDREGNSSGSGSFGPYGGWDSRAVADGADGLTRVLWSNADGTAALWLVGPEGNQASYPLGPAAGWTAADVTASGAGTTELLRTNADGRMALWRIDNAGGVSSGPIYGPYPGWTAISIADGQDGLTRVLWKKADGSAGVSFHNTEGLLASHQFGPAAGWTANDIAVGADGQTRILWTHRDGRMALWRVDDAGNPTALGPIYSPPAGLTASRVAAGSDGLTRVLWADVKGTAVLWIMSADDVLINTVSLGPDDEFN